VSLTAEHLAPSRRDVEARCSSYAPRVRLTSVLLFAALAVTVTGCYQVHEREGAPRVDAGIVTPVDAFVTPVDAFVLPPVDASTTTETIYALTTGQCFTIATRAIEDGGGMRCGDFTLEGDFAAYLVGIDGTLCGLDGRFASLDAIPTMPGDQGCGRVINLQIGDGTSLGFLLRLDGHTYRVHVFSSTPPTMMFSFDEVL
jgi:hypothetical protein